MSTQTSTIALNTDYIKSRNGLLRIAEAVIGLCGIISESQGAVCYGQTGMYSFYNFVVVTTLIIALIVLIVFFLGLDKLCTFINCGLSVFINDVIFSILYLIAAILMFVTLGCTHGQVARIFAALFGVCGTIVVGLLALDGYQTFRGNQAAPKSEPA